MLYRLLTMVFFFIMLVLGIMIIRRSKLPKKKLLRGIWSVILIPLWLFSAELPTENLFRNFTTPEEAFSCVYSNGSKLIVDGALTSLAINDNHCRVIQKTDKGWKNTLFIQTTTLYNKFIEGVNVEVYRHKATGDCYISIIVPYSDTYAITDNKQSTFLEYPGNTEDKNYQVPVCFYGYIGTLNEDYELNVNGVVFQVPKYN